MTLPAIQALRAWLDRHPDAMARAALEDIEAMCRDGERIQRFVSRRRILPSQRLRERALVEQRLREYRACHSTVSQRSAGRWIASVLRLPSNRVRGYLEQIVAEERAASSVRDECSTLSRRTPLTLDASDATVTRADKEPL